MREGIDDEIAAMKRRIAGVEMVLSEHRPFGEVGRLTEAALQGELSSLRAKLIVLLEQKIAGLERG